MHIINAYKWLVHKIIWTDHSRSGGALVMLVSWSAFVFIKGNIEYAFRPHNLGQHFYILWFTNPPPLKIGELFWRAFFSFIFPFHPNLRFYFSLPPKFETFIFPSHPVKFPNIQICNIYYGLFSYFIKFVKIDNYTFVLPSYPAFFSKISINHSIKMLALF